MIKMSNKAFDLVRGPNTGREIALKLELQRKIDELAAEKVQHQQDLSKLQAKYANKNQNKNVEYTLMTLKECYKDARAEIEYLKKTLHEALEQTVLYKDKYLLSLQTVEEHKQLLEVQNMDNMRIAEQINLEILSIRQKYNEKVQVLEPYPELLKKTEMSLNKEREQNAKAEHTIAILTNNLKTARERIHVLMHTMVEVCEEPDEDIYKKKQLQLLLQKIESMAGTIQSQKMDIEKLKSKILYLEDKDLENDKRLMKKMQECIVLGGEIDETRLGANEAIDQLSKQHEVTRKKMEIQIKDLEQKLKMAEVKLLNTEKEKEQVENALQCKISHLNEDYKRANQRILELNAMVQELKRTRTPDDNGDDLDDRCACKTFVDAD